MKKIIVHSLIITFLVIPKIGHCVAGFADIVFDPSNYANTLLTQYNTLKSTVNEATQIAQEARSLVMQAQNMVQLPLNYAAKIQAEMAGYTNLLQQIRGMGYSINSVAHQFEDIFSTGGFGVGDILRKAQAMQNAVRQAGWTGAQAQAIYEQLCVQITDLNQAVAASAGAKGSLEAQQAQAQILGVLGRQQATLQETLAASERVQTGFIMMQVTDRQQGEINASHFFDGFGAQGFKGVGQTQGVPLP